LVGQTITLSGYILREIKVIQVCACYSYKFLTVISVDSVIVYNFSHVCLIEETYHNTINYISKHTNIEIETSKYTRQLIIEL